MADQGTTIWLDGQTSVGSSYTTTSAYPGKVAHYKMTGYYATGTTFESFVNLLVPTAASVTNPNTGHALTDTYVDSYWLA